MPNGLLRLISSFFGAVIMATQIANKLRSLASTESPMPSSRLAAIVIAAWLVTVVRHG